MTSLLVWLGNNPSTFAVVACGLTAGAILFGIAPWPDRTERRADVAFLSLAAAAIVFCRIPVLASPDALNPDEAQMIANALKATVDIVPWRGFDGATSGPLNSDVLVLPALVGAHIDYFSARIVGLLLVVAGLIALFAAVRWTYGSALARLALIPPVAFFAVARHADLVHYSSEHLPIFLTGAGLAACAYLWSERLHRYRPIAALLGGATVGCIPFAKLQATPIAIALLATLLAAVIVPRGRRASQAREVAWAVAGCFLPPAIILTSILSVGEYHDFIVSYVAFAASYVSVTETVGIAFFTRSAVEFSMFLLIEVTTTIVGFALAVLARRRPARIAALGTASAVALTIAAVFAVYEAHRGYPHYLLLMVIPIAWLAANALGIAKPWGLRYMPRRWLIPAYGALTAGLAIAVYENQADRYLADLPASARWPRAAVSEVISRFAPAGTHMVVWGWMPQYYVQTQTIMGTRDGNTYHQIMPGPLQGYFRERFMDDMVKGRPQIVVDAVAPKSFGFHDPATQGIGSFPQLERLIASRYRLVAIADGVHIYRFVR